MGHWVVPSWPYVTDYHLKTPTLPPLNVNFSVLSFCAYIFIYMERSLFLFMWVDVKCKFLQLADAYIIKTKHIKKKLTLENYTNTYTDIYT